MQQHPVPRNVTGFQFKLVGNMTLKQFGYLVAGVVAGYLFFKLLPAPEIIKVAGGLLSAAGGAALAFIPIQGRPLDVWIRAFFKSVYSPTQYIWKKESCVPLYLKGPRRGKASKQQLKDTDYEEVEVKLKSYLQKKEKKPHQLLDSQEGNALEKTKKAMAKVAETVPKARSKGQENKTKAPEVQNKKAFCEKVENHKKIADKLKLAMQKRTPTQKTTHAKWQKTEKADRVHVLEKDETTEAGFPKAPSVPNLIAGVILDPKENYLPGILVTIKNREKVVVLALKTNSLGQFTSSNPLPKDDYIIEAEDPKGRFTFDIIKIELRGKIVAPLQIVAKPGGEALKLENKQSEIRAKLFKQTPIN